MTDKEIIYLAYLKAYSGIKGKKIDRAKYSQKRMEITQRIDRCMMTCKYSVSDIDKRRAVLFGKNIYREYCIFVIANPEGKTDQLKERILELVDKISEIEEQEVFLYKYTLEEGSELNLREILKKGIYIKELTLIGITEVIKHAVENKQITAIIRHQLYNVTLTGKLYHKDGCRYCSGKDVIKIDIASEKGKKYKPCSCIKGKGIQKRILSARKDHKTCLTAFLDESRRDDPIKLIVPGRTDKQNVMSYVICKGYLQGESEIEDKNIVEEDVYLSPSKSSNLNLAIHETFARIMVRAAMMPRIHDLVIYSDNQSACEEWQTVPPLKHLSEHFRSVNIEFIPREKNKYADALGRKKEILVVDKGEISELLGARRELNKLLDEMMFVRNYFPNPRFMIPNLVEELRLMAEEKQKTEIKEVHNVS